MRVRGTLMMWLQAGAVGRGDWKRVAEISESVLRKTPDNGYFRSTLVLSHARTGRLDEAIAVGSAALAERPDNFILLQLLADCCAKKEDWESTYRYTRQALGSSVPEEPPFLLLRVMQPFGRLVLRLRGKDPSKADATAMRQEAREHERAWREWAEGFCRWYEARNHGGHSGPNKPMQPTGSAGG
jgi:hypothetical protein